MAIKINILIKPSTESDIQSIIEVYTKSYLENYTYLWLDDGSFYMNLSFNFEKIKEEMSDPNSLFYLVQHAEKNVGVIKINLDKKSEDFSAEEAMELERIYFIKEATGKGLGRESINFVINYARQRNKKLLWLKAMDSSAAVAFYKKMDFNIVGQSFLTYSEMKPEYRGMYLMHLEL
jgi:diamine N-acetyltransferase